MFRIIRFNNRSTTEIQFQFSEEIASSITLDNIRVRSNVENVDDLVVKSIRIKKSVLTITTSPQAPLILYYVEFVSSNGVEFKSVDGNTLQNNNVYFFLGQERANDIRNNVLSNLSSVEDVDNDTFIRKYLSGISDELLDARNSIREAGNANYIEVEVKDEIKSRGYSVNDRLNNEGAFEILRVSKSPEGATRKQIINFFQKNASSVLDKSNVDFVNPSYISFPSDRVSLQQKNIIKEIVSNRENKNNKLDGLLITVENQTVIRLNALTLIKTDGTRIAYDIPRYGYMLADTSYDSRFSRKLITLGSNQIKLADNAVISGDFELPSGEDKVEVSYTYKDVGINAIEDNFSITQVKTATREPTKAVSTVFSLKNSPVVNSSGEIVSSGGVEFLDPSASSGMPYTKVHPAFKIELPYNTTKLPANPGEYSVDYSSGRVFVYGASSNDGTGHNPPVANYSYRRHFVDGVDFNSDFEKDEIVAIPGRDIIGSNITISYDIEEIFREGIDYKNECHVEVINEFVENRVRSDNIVTPLNSPITKVFEVVNETTGEKYSVSRFSDNYIYINGRSLPKKKTVVGEVAKFKLVEDETLFASEELNNDGATKIVKIELANELVLANSSGQVGSNVDSSLLLSKSEVFVREFFYDSILQTLAQNVSKLSLAGDYIVDYQQGVIYLLIGSDFSGSFGVATYKCGEIETTFPQILSVDSINIRSTSNSSSIADIDMREFTSTNVVVDSLPSSVDRFYNEDLSQTIVLGAVAFGKAGQSVPGTYEFVASDGDFVDDYADGYHILRISGEPDRAITAVSSSKKLLVDIPFTELSRELSWCIIDFNLSDGYQIAVNHDISFINGVYTVDDLQLNHKDALVNLFDREVDVLSGNTIIFNNSNISSLSPGTALAVNYSPGEVYVSYQYLEDTIRISYEYGDNSINFGISDVLKPNEQYFVSYKYGALRDKLLENFGTLTRVSELLRFPYNFDRELYRDFVGGALASFVKGPTTEAIKSFVKRITSIEPNINELSFDEWTVGRDHLFLHGGETGSEPQYAIAHFNNGLVINNDQYLKFPGEAHISYREGTFEAWVIPYWNGLDNDATLTFSLSGDPDSIYIGASAKNPDNSYFSVNREDVSPTSPIGKPINFLEEPGHFIWFDDSENRWHYVATTDGYGEISSSGEFYSVSDGYNIFSSNSTIKFDGYGDSSDGYFDGSNYEIRNSFSFSSDDVHYIMDTGADLNHNRISIYKDGSGYLNFRVLDDSGRKHPSKSREYVVSSNIQDWRYGEAHLVAASWRLNTSEGADEMHLFVDGQEVSNLFKYGGKPSTANTDLYRTVAKEILTPSSTKTTVGASDGYSFAGSDIFTSLSIDFIELGISPGDSFHILESNLDGVLSPYSIVSVGTHSLQLSAPLSLTMDNISFSVNQQSFETNTNIDVEKIAIFTEDGYGSKKELYGLEASEPDYSISRDDSKNTLIINNGITKGEQVYIETLGLSVGRCRDQIYNYNDGYSLHTKSAPPISLDHVDIYKVFVPRISIEADGYFSSDGYISVIGAEAHGILETVGQPSNQVKGKKISATLGGYDNIDFGENNYVKISGTTYSGATSETLTFLNFGTQETVEYFISITQVEFVFTAIDPQISLGSIELMESIPFTMSENGGDYAQVSSYNNGVFNFVIFGSGGVDFDIEGNCYYKLDYPVNLNIPLKRKGDLWLGSSMLKANQFKGVLDQVVILDEMLEDIRAGETKSYRTITRDFNSPLPLEKTSQTLMLLNLDNSIDIDETNYDSYPAEYFTSGNSVNPDFGDAAVFFANKSMEIDNGTVVFNNNEGTIEFWVSPLIDSVRDDNERYFIDLTSIKIENVISSTANTVILPSKGKRVISVKIASDSKDETNYLGDGSLRVDGKTIDLGISLPSKNTVVEVHYVPIDFNGERVSIWKDSSSNIKFAIGTSSETYMISYPVVWGRNTWHKIKASWLTNTTTNQDEMRLFIDGLESGTVLWGSPGLVYGDGTVYGAGLVGSAGSNTLIADINLSDNFDKIHVGNSYDQRCSAAAKIDNLRFSDIVREPAIIANKAMDLHYNENYSAALPVIEDNNTTAMYDFERVDRESNHLANLYSKYTPQYLFEVEVDDGFSRLNSPVKRKLLSDIIERMRPSHTKMSVKFLQELNS